MVFSCYLILILFTKFSFIYSFSFNFKYFYFKDLFIYDLKPLSRPKDNINDLIIQGQDQVIYYNIYGNTIYKCFNENAQIILINNGTCYILSGKNDEENIIDSFPNKYEGLSITMNKGNNRFIKNNETIIYFQIKIEIKCNPKIKTILFKNIPYIHTLKSLNYTFSAESTNACPIFSIDMLNERPYELIVTIFIILIGFIISFFGLRLFKELIFISSSLIVFCILFLLFYELVLSNGSESYLFWICFGGSIIASFLISYLITKLTSLFCSLIGIVFGLVLGVMVNFLLEIVIKFPYFANVLIIIGFIFFTAILCLIFYESSCIFLTSFFGSYLLVRGISKFIGKFPSEQIIWSLIQKNSLTKLNENGVVIVTI